MEVAMSKKVGLWIDHKSAFIVSIDERGLTTSVIESHVEPRFRFSGGSRSSSAHGTEVASEQKRDKRYMHHLERYYEQVVDAVADARRILVLGPGEAKVELKNRIEKSRVKMKPVINVEPSDKLTEPQILARIREYYKYFE
jgi:stalled ribosome rescue protein Dom34